MFNFFHHLKNVSSGKYSILNDFIESDFNPLSARIENNRRDFFIYYWAIHAICGSFAILNHLFTTSLREIENPLDKNFQKINLGTMRAGFKAIVIFYLNRFLKADNAEFLKFFNYDKRSFRDKISKVLEFTYEDIELLDNLNQTQDGSQFSIKITKEFLSRILNTKADYELYNLKFHLYFILFFHESYKTFLDSLSESIFQDPMGKKIMKRMVKRSVM